MRKIHVVSLSGGKDSTAMLLMMIEKKMPIDKIIFVDTGVEFPEMYDHLKKLSKYIKRRIIRLKADKSFEYYLLDHNNNGRKGYGWARHNTRWCTSNLKTEVMKKYLKKYGNLVVEYHGIAYDEEHRINNNQRRKKKVEIRYPLYEWGITEQEALQYCYDHGFDWGGLYEKFDRVSCFLCPLKSLKELKVIWKDFPHLWAIMRDYDNRTYRKFRSDYSILELEEKFRKEELKNG